MVVIIIVKKKNDGDNKKPVAPFIAVRRTTGGLSMGNIVGTSKSPANIRHFTTTDG